MKVIGSFLGKLHVLGKILHSRCFHVAWQILIHLISTPIIQCPPLLKLGFTSTFQFRMLLIRGQFSWNRNAAALGAIHTNWSTMPHSSIEMWILRQGWGGALFSKEAYERDQVMAVLPFPSKKVTSLSTQRLQGKTWVTFLVLIVTRSTNQSLLYPPPSFFRVIIKSSPTSLAVM